MAMVVADVPAVHTASDPGRALFTLSVLTGVVMLAAGLLRLGASVERAQADAVAWVEANRRPGGTNAQ